MPGSSVDVAIVGGGHNGLVAATLLARAGRSVVVLERRGEVGGAAVSERPFPGVDARVSRYAYLVSLLPRALARDLGLDLELRRRRVASYTPVGDGGVLNPDAGAFGAMAGRLARAVFPTVLAPLLSRARMRELVGDDAAWEALVERPVGEAIEAAYDDDVLRGIVATDALIGTFAAMRDPDLRQNRCLLYHVIGNGTGGWDVPVGGMGAVTAALAAAARAAGPTCAPAARRRRSRPTARCASTAARWRPGTCCAARRRRCSTGCWRRPARSRRGPARTRRRRARS